MARTQLDWSIFVDPVSGLPLAAAPDGLYSEAGDRRAPIRGGIPEFIEDGVQDHFGFQWKRFASVQLDSVNGMTQTRDRLLHQSGLTQDDFRGKTVLEVGCGAGRFTEILLGFGARVVSVDYSSAVHTNHDTHAVAAREGRATFARADVFALPFRPQSFDIVLCYGVVQHTGDASQALTHLWEMVAVDGLLLVDRYRISLRNVAPWKHLLRPASRRLGPTRLLAMTERAVSRIFPLQVRAFARLQGNGSKRLLRLALIRFMPNSVFPIQLHLQRQLDAELALTWSILDTFDMYGPSYDEPQTYRNFKRDVSRLPDAVVERCAICGQGNTATIRRRRPS